MSDVDGVYEVLRRYQLGNCDERIVALAQHAYVLEQQVIKFENANFQRVLDFGCEVQAATRNLLEPQVPLPSTCGPECRAIGNTGMIRHVLNCPTLKQGVHVEEEGTGQCAHATGKHDQECDLVAGLTAELEEARRMSEPHEDVCRTAYVVSLEKQVAAVNATLEELERIGWPCRLEDLPKRYEELTKQLQEAREEVFDLYHQACCVSNPLVAGVTAASACKYDNQCMSTYESIEEKLIEWGLLKPEQCLRRPLKTNLLKDTLLKVPVDPAPVTPEWADEEKK